jgi:hypothetical protein
MSAPSIYQTVSFTIGSVMGNLMNAMRYYVDGDAHSLNAYFYRDKDGNIYLINILDDDNYFISLSAGRHGVTQPAAIILRGNTEYNVTQFFTDCAKKNLNTLTLTVGMGIPCNNDKCAVTVAASGQSLYVGAGRIQINKYIGVRVAMNNIVLYTDENRLVAVYSLIIDGNIRMCLYDLYSNCTGHFDISLPCALRGEHAIDLSLACQIEIAVP